MTNNNEAPANAGSDHNLPQHVREAANLGNHHTVIAWTHLDPAYDQDIRRYFCCQSFGPFLVCPCVLPFLVVLGPCLYWGRLLAEKTVRSTYWILTDTTLKIVLLDTPYCGGCCSTGVKVKSIPLESITDCGIDSRGEGAVNKCAGELPTIYVDTASSSSSSDGTTEHEAVGIGLENYEWFMDQILRQRDAGKVAPTVQTINRVVVDNKTAEERIQEAQRLLDRGLIAQDEFDRKRNEIIASI